MMEFEWLADLLLLPAGCGWDTQKETKLWLPMCIDGSQSFEPLYTLNWSAVAIRNRASKHRVPVSILGLQHVFYVCLEDTGKVRLQ